MGSPHPTTSTLLLQYTYRGLVVEFLGLSYPHPGPKLGPGLGGLPWSHKKAQGLLGLGRGSPSNGSKGGAPSFLFFVLVSQFPNHTPGWRGHCLWA